jgi:hypothetical protein
MAEVDIKVWLDEVVTNVRGQMSDFTDKQRHTDGCIADLKTDIRQQLDSLREDLMAEITEMKNTCHETETAATERCNTLENKVDRFTTKIRTYATAALIGGGVLSWALKMAWDVYKTTSLTR